MDKLTDDEIKWVKDNYNFDNSDGGFTIIEVALGICLQLLLSCVGLSILFAVTKEMFFAVMAVATFVIGVTSGGYYLLLRHMESMRSSAYKDNQNKKGGI